MPSSGVQTCALRSEEHTSELQSPDNLVCRLLLEKKRQLVGELGEPLRAAARAGGGGAGPGARAESAAAVACCAAHASTSGDRSLYPFFFNDPPPPEISPLPLHAALPI